MVDDPKALSWVVVSSIFLEFSPRSLGKIFNLTKIFSNGLKPPTSKDPGMLLKGIPRIQSYDLNMRCFDQLISIRSSIGRGLRA